VLRNSRECVLRTTWVEGAKPPAFLYASAKPAGFGITKPDASTTSYMQAWYTGGAPATVTVTMSDGGSLTVAPGGYGSNAGITMYNYAPGTQFYPWTSKILLQIAAADEFNQGT